MNKRLRALVVFLALMSLPFAAAAQRITVVGTVYGTYEIVTDSGEVYEVAADEKGGELAELDGMRVRASGVLEVEGGDMILQVLSYSLLDEEPYDEEEMIEEQPLEAGPPVEEDYLLEEDGVIPEEEYLEEELLEEELQE